MIPLALPLIRQLQVGHFCFGDPRLRWVNIQPALTSRSREPQRSDFWGHWMTVCIVARCVQDDSFVTISDRSSVENATVKKIDVTPRWHVLYAGSPCEVMPILLRAHNLLGTAPTPVNWAMHAMEKAYQKHREVLVNNRILSKFGVTLRQFSRDGLKLFTAQEHQQIVTRIDTLKVGLDFLVYGYDKNNTAHIFSVTDPGDATSLDIEGYGGIGAGWVLADAALTARPLPVDSKTEMMYRICEAKFAAEGARSVGRETVLSFWNSPTTTPLGNTLERFLNRINIEAIRREWARDLARKLPKKALETIQHAYSGSLSADQIGIAGKPSLRPRAA